MANENLDGAVRHAANAIRNAEGFASPFPHICFRDFFPADVYRRLLDGFPDDVLFHPLNGQGTRRQYNLYERSGDPARDVWTMASNVLSSEAIMEALRERLDEGLHIRARRSGEAWPVPMVPRPVLYADRAGYAIKPHPDTRKKVLTMQIYLPSDESRRDLGTAIYKVSPMGVFAWKSYGLVKAKTVPFLPNSGYAFVVIHPAWSLTRTSWHGREAIAVPDDRPRRSILNTYYRAAPAAKSGLPEL